MDIAQVSAQLRSEYTADMHQAVIDKWPMASAIGPRPNGYGGEHLLHRLPKDPAELVEELHRRVAAQKVELDKERQRYDDIRRRGPAALSDYDIAIAHRNCEDAVRCSLMLKTAHVSAAVSGLMILRQALEDAAERLERERPQMMLF